LPVVLDLFIFPTRADNLPLVLQESMACGTPMVSFKVGGVPDLVRPGITGYLATPEMFCKWYNSWKIKICDRTWVNNVARLMNTHNYRLSAMLSYTVKSCKIRG